MVQAFAPEMIDPSEDAQPSLRTPHSRDDEDTVLVGAATDSSPAEPSPPLGGELGRFVVLEQVGAGGMGRVLRAYDPKLHREVALKLMRSVDPTATERMLREARAMAQLSHPNVVPVFDVGEHARGLFIAMEYVEGMTMRQWCEKDRPGWRDVIRVFQDAGEGLAAAHRVGLVHRDFKPDNVLIDASGRARVMDFGLARAADDDLEEEYVSGGRAPVNTGPGPDALTEIGTVLGTPAYMAPEQHRGITGDRRSDQYSFCVALYEALHGRRPFAGESIEALARAKDEMRLVSPPPNAPAVPKRLDRVIWRGLQSDPSSRWPSVEALLAELGRDDARRWRRRFLLSFVALAVTVIAVLLVRHRAQLCTGAQLQLTRVWDTTRSSDLEASFLATGVPNAADTWTRVHAHLDAYAAAWVASHKETCEATRKRGEQSQELMDARMHCLQGRRRELAALVDTLVMADASVVQKAVDAVLALPRVDRCDDIDYVLAQVAPPDDPAVEAEVEALREKLAQARAHHAAGRYAEGLPIAREVAREAEALAYAPLVAEASRWLAALEEGTGAYDAALASLRRAYFEARRSRVDEIAAESSSALVFLLGAHLSRHDDALSWAEHARADVDRVGTVAMRAAALNHTALVHFNRGSYDTAETLYEEALATLGQPNTPENSSVVSSSLSGLAFIHHTRGSSADAIRLFEQALELREQAVGSEHPDIAVALSNLGLVHRARGSFDEAIRVNERALAIREATLGPEHSEVGASLTNLGSVYFATRDYEKALSLYQRALAIREQAFGSDHPKLGEVLNNLAATHAARGDIDMSAVMHERALAIWKAVHGPDHPLVATSLNNLGNVARSRGEYDEAARLYGQALRAWETTLGPEHLHTTHALIGLGETAQALGRPEEAIAPLERATSLRQTHDALPTDVAAACFALARALWDAAPRAGRDRERARALALQARDVYRQTGEADSLAEVEAWLKEPSRSDRLVR